MNAINYKVQHSSTLTVYIICSVPLCYMCISKQYKYVHSVNPNAQKKKTETYNVPFINTSTY